MLDIQDQPALPDDEVVYVHPSLVTVNFLSCCFLHFRQDDEPLHHFLEGDQDAWTLCNDAQEPFRWYPPLDDLESSGIHSLVHLYRTF